MHHCRTLSACKGKKKRDGKIIEEREAEIKRRQCEAIDQGLNKSYVSLFQSLFSAPGNLTALLSGTNTG